MARRYTILNDLQREAVVLLTRSMSHMEVAEVFEVCEMTVSRILKEPGPCQRAWMRTDDRHLPPAGAPAGRAWDDDLADRPSDIPQIAFGHAMKALRRGRAGEGAGDREGRAVGRRVGGGGEGSAGSRAGRVSYSRGFAGMR